MRNKLKERRLELGLTLQEVADKVGVSAATVSRWESGEIENMRRDRIASLAKVLKVEPNFIMGVDFPDEKQKNNYLPNLTKKEKFEYDKFMESATYFFNDETVSDEDKKKFSDALQNAFITALMHKKKKKKK